MICRQLQATNTKLTKNVCHVLMVWDITICYKQFLNNQFLQIVFPYFFICFPIAGHFFVLLLKNFHACGSPPSFFGRLSRAVRVSVSSVSDFLPCTFLSPCAPLAPDLPGFFPVPMFALQIIYIYHHIILYLYIYIVYRINYVYINIYVIMYVYIYIIYSLFCVYNIYIYGNYI